MENVECNDCGTQYSENLKECPNCGSRHRRVSIEIHSNVHINSEIRGMRGKNPHYPGKRKIRWEWIDENRVQKGDGITPIHYHQLIDRDSDVYEEKVIHLKTGEVIHKCNEPLSEHRGHGSDKSKQ